MPSQFQVPAYVDRLMLVAKNSDGLSQPVEKLFIDRVGQTGSFQKLLDQKIVQSIACRKTLTTCMCP